ncbi:FabD/lysophospholipase-like protein [Epithele typhae]|uniref:FabD/lysophospholipase-like protein n=1 Tax=Epithele typhae TaxID=378194 RepID=UPI002007A463|nr:FabD/lysophospholipase-like protein [Epithele typhae]KAH9915462.1 FabD/lysophospholipase-like protein [Epithele typhae]
MQYGLFYTGHDRKVISVSPPWSNTLTVWALQERFSALLLEFGHGPGSLFDQIINQPPDIAVHPEVDWDAEVRLGEDLCIAERAFLGERKRKMRVAFASLMGVPESEVDERDLPIVAIAGSGGGFRACLNTLGSLKAAQSTGIFDCVTYTAGVSGSCWALGILYSGVAGSHSPVDAAAHAKDRLKTSYLDMNTLDNLINAPTNSYLLEGILRKTAGVKSMVSLVDLYGTLISSRLYVPSELDRLDPRHLSMHFFRHHIDDGTLPLPIFSAIQHVTPPEKAAALYEVEGKQAVTLSPRKSKALGEEHDRLAQTVRWLWYEFTPYEVGCDEIGAWIPSWALGRSFMNGKSLERSPELSFSILTGIFGSAFCASLKHYFREVEPMLHVLPVQLYTWLKDVVTENEQDLGLIHPVLPNQLPNFLKGLVGQLRFDSPPYITEQDTLSFMDAGAELNIPYYPFLRRNDLWFTRAEELAIKRGLTTWPRGATWPSRVVAADGSKPSPGVPQYEASSAAEANRKLAETQESALAKQTEKHGTTASEEMHDMPSDDRPPCEVWIGSSKAPDDDGARSARLDELDEAALLARDGIAVVYVPLAPNAARVPGFDPAAVSTWAREVGEAESQALLDVAEANFEESREKIVRLLRAVWMRKRMARRRAEWEAQLGKLRERLGTHMQ